MATNIVCIIWVLSHFPFLVWFYSTQEMTGSLGNNCSERSKRKLDWEHCIIACAREKKNSNDFTTHRYKISLENTHCGFPERISITTLSTAFICCSCISFKEAALLLRLLGFYSVGNSFGTHTPWAKAISVEANQFCWSKSFHWLVSKCSFAKGDNAVIKLLEHRGSSYLGKSGHYNLQCPVPKEQAFIAGAKGKLFRHQLHSA